MKTKNLGYLIPRVESKSESFAHKVIKQLIYTNILEHNLDIIDSCLEKYFETRRADVYFKFKSGEEVVVEIQNSPISSKEITARTKDYNNRGIFVLWIFYGNGKCIGSPKCPHHLKNLKISPAEMRLHQLYRGRAYYVNITYTQEKFRPTQPYALHFSFSDKYSPTIFRKGFETFFIRNVNYTHIPNWNLFCTTYGNYKIARFYDRNAKYTLMELISGHANRNYIIRDKSYFKTKNTKKYLKLTYKIFGDEYGRNIIIDALLRLTDNNGFMLNVKYLKKYKKSLFRRAKTKLSKSSF